MDDEWDEEEQMVVVELSGIINNDFLNKGRGTCKILDIDSEKPMMQIGQYVFAGEYEDSAGTCVLFEEESNKGKTDAAPGVKYMCHTVKKLMMQRIFLTEKKESETSTGSCEGDGQGASTSLTGQQEGNRHETETQEEMDSTDSEGSAAV